MLTETCSEQACVVRVGFLTRSLFLHPSITLQSFQKEIALNTERIDGLIVFGEALIQKSSPQDAALIEDELEELHLYCQEVFSRLVRFHQRLSQPPVSSTTHLFVLERNSSASNII